MMAGESGRGVDNPIFPSENLLCASAQYNTARYLSVWGYFLRKRLFRRYDSVPGDGCIQRGGLHKDARAIMFGVEHFACPP